MVSPIGVLISQGYTFAQGIVGICAFGMLVLAGLAYMVPWIKKSIGMEPIQIVQNVVIGVVLLFSAYIILNTINHSLVAQPTDSGLPLPGQQ